jgi:hypothetical protein
LPFPEAGPAPTGPEVPPPIIQNLYTLIAQVIAWVIASFNNVIAGIVSLFNALKNILVQVFHSLGKFLLHIWQNYIRKAITWLASHVQKLRAWLKRTITPIIKRLEAIKKWYDEHILKQQLRLWQMIQNIRRFLGILRLFHVKWAAQLDGALADIQNRIQESIAIVRGTLNQIINTLALVLDPTLLITKNVLGGSILGNLKAVRGIFGIGDGRIVSGPEQATMDKQHALYLISTVNAHVKTVATTGLTPQDQQDRADFRKAFEEVRGAPPPF